MTLLSKRPCQPPLRAVNGELLNELTSLKALLNKSVYDFDVVVSPKRTKVFKWTVNIEHATLEGQKSSIRAMYQTPALENDGPVLNMLNDSGKYSSTKRRFFPALLKHLIAELEARQVKDEDFYKGIAQNAVQPESALSNRKYKANEMEEEDLFTEQAKIQTIKAEEAQKADSAVNLGGEQEIKKSINNIILAGMQSEIDLLRQHFTELEAKYIGIRAEKAELEARNAIPELGRKYKADSYTENDYGRMQRTVDIPDSAVVKLEQSPTSKSSEDRKADSFLDEVNKKSVSDNIRRRNREKKLQSESAKNQPQDLSDCYTTPSTSKHHIVHFRKTLLYLLSEIQKEALASSVNTSKFNNVVADGEGRQLISDAEDAEGKTIKAKQKEKCMLSQVYTMIKSSLPKISESNLYKKTQRAGSVYKLFKKIIDPETKKEVMGIGIDKVYGISYGVRNISELSDAQIINIIKSSSGKARDILTIGQEQYHVTEISTESDERSDRFSLNSSALCPIYNRDHKEKTIVKGEWGSDELHHGIPIYKKSIIKEIRTIIESLTIIQKYFKTMKDLLSL
ncbi:hypothetical protein GLOIN_2v1487451 [Rhizophagus irregularis DAOM 181602=DAOM 197198]|nr:hypothetical protein GLOIN_2v1487451 [Rhizophagus irregularis DAOM 181602=DAOM 197198]